MQQTLSPFPDWTPIFGFILGAFIGSFLNMAIYRLPRGLSFVDPSRSFCPNCKHSLASMDLIPILSWIFAGGKCRYCKQPVSSRYLWVEVLTGTLYAGVWWRFLVQSYEPIRAAAYLLTVACLVAIIFIDWELYIIPDEINAIVLMIAVVYRWADHSLEAALKGALLGWGLIFGVQLLGRVMFGKDAMGDGDTKMMRGVGALLGPTLLVGNFAAAVILGLVGGVLGILISKSQKASVASESGDGVEGESAPDEDVTPMATPVSFQILAGVWYLLCLDVVCLVVPPLRRWIESRIPPEAVEEEEDWKPSATQIPFGPYLAAGALACMLFPGVVEGAIQSYLHLLQPSAPSVPGPALLTSTFTRLN